jgi:transposase
VLWCSTNSTINTLFRDVLNHYGAVALPCRVRDPDRKGKVESGVGQAQKTGWSYDKKYGTATSGDPILMFCFRLKEGVADA